MGPAVQAKPDARLSPMSPCKPHKWSDKNWLSSSAISCADASRKLVRSPMCSTRSRSWASWLTILHSSPNWFRKNTTIARSFPANDLTAKLDALTELGQFEAIDGFDISFSRPVASDADLEPVLDLVNRLTRTFVVYIGNMVTIFEKEFQLLMERFRQSLQQGEIHLDAVELTPSDMAELEKEAAVYLDAGQFLQALSFDRLLRSEVITKELVILPSADYSFNKNLLKRGQKDADRFASLVKFILRACYISQGAWQDNFVTLVDLLYADEDVGRRSQLIDTIDQDGVFCCNLLRESFANLKKWSPTQRRAAIEKKLETCRAGPGSSRLPGG